MRVFWTIAIAFAAWAMPRTGHAEVRDLALAGWYGKVGVTTGVAFGREDRGTSALLGGVATLVRLNDHLEWAGVQADVLADGNGDGAAGARWSIGPELGRSIFGVDTSYFGERAFGQTRHGVQLRAKLTVGVAAIYGRVSYALRGTEQTTFDLGLQLKLPVLIKRKPPPPIPVANR